MNLSQLAAAVIAELTPSIGQPNAPRRASLTNAIMTAFRPHVEHALTGAPPKVIRDATDKRERRWLVSLSFTDGTDIIAASAGREIDTGGKPITYGGDEVTGLDGVAELIADYAGSIKAPLDTFGLEPMRKALGYLRPTISRQGGRGTMRRTSPDGRWHLIADVFREGRFPKA